jgi:hypothetical protein
MKPSPTKKNNTKTISRTGKVFSNERGDTIKSMKYIDISKLHFVEGFVQAVIDIRKIKIKNQHIKY